MIIDSHCHAWRRWPYQPAVPDDESRGSIEQLLFEMDQNGVDQAVVICANIHRNPENNDYVFEGSIKYPDRIHFFPDIDSGGEGRPETYHTPGASDRLRRALDKWPLKGFNHYLLPDDDGAWLYSEEGLEFFGVAADAGLIASIACGPHHSPPYVNWRRVFLQCRSSVITWQECEVAKDPLNPESNMYWNRQDCLIYTSMYQAFTTAQA